MPTLPSADGPLPVAQSSRRIVGYDATQVSRANAQLGQAVGGAIEKVAGGMLEKQDRYSYAQAKSSFLKAQLEVENELEQDQDYTTYTQRYNERMTKARDEAAKMIRSPNDRALFQQDLDLDIQRGLGSVQRKARAREVDTERGSLMQTITSNREAALRAGDEGAKVSIIKATQEAIDGARERGYLSDQESVQWRQRATEDYALSSIEMLDPAKQIEALDTSKFASLIPSDKRAALRAVAENKIRIQQDRAQAQADRREAKAERALFQYQQQIASGIPSTTDSVNRWAAAVQGTAMEGEFVALSKGEQEVQSLMREPLDAQIRFVEEKRASLQKSGGTLAEAANIDRLERAVNSNVKMLREQPLAFYAVRSGESPAPIDLGGLQTEDGLSQLAGQLGERFDAVTSLRKQYGSEVARNPWRPEEIPMVKAFIAQADDDTKLNLFGSIAAASPTAADYSAALKEISADQPITMLAGMAHARGLKGADGTEVPRVLLAGSKVLADKSTPMPSEKELRLAFDEQVGSSIASGTPQREQAYIAFKSIYAGLSGSRGIRHEDSFTNDELVDEAVLLSTGGIGERAGAKVVKPYGMGDKDFDKAVDAQLEALTKKSGFLFRELEDMPLTPVPGKEGAYYLMNAGRIQLDPKTSEPMTVTVK